MSFVDSQPLLDCRQPILLLWTHSSPSPTAMQLTQPTWLVMPLFITATMRGIAHTQMSHIKGVPHTVRCTQHTWIWVVYLPLQIQACCAAIVP